MPEDICSRVSRNPKGVGQPPLFKEWPLLSIMCEAWFITDHMSCKQMRKLETVTIQGRTVKQQMIYDRHAWGVNYMHLGACTRCSRPCCASVGHELPYGIASSEARPTAQKFRPALPDLRGFCCKINMWEPRIARGNKEGNSLFPLVSL